MKNNRLSTNLLLLLFTAVIPGLPAIADDDVAVLGKQSFEGRCAVCHGLDGKGSGIVAKLLTQKPTDLTQLSKANAGVFPFGHVYQAIDGRNIPAAHGSREMPVWGREFADQAGPTQKTDSYVRGKVLELIVYLESIQE